MRVSNPDRSAKTPQPALIAKLYMMRPLYHRRFLHTFYVRSRQRVDEFHEACLVRITNGGLAVWLHPVGMFEAQVVVNLLAELGVGADLVKHGSWLVKDPAVWLARVGGASMRQQPSERARKGGTHLSCWRCSNTASSPLCVRVGVDFDRTWLFLVFIISFSFLCSHR